MKKFTVAMCLIALMPFVASSAHAAKRSGRKSGYTNIITNNFYYSQPGRVAAYSPTRKSSSTDFYTSEKSTVMERVEESHSSQMRKYFLAHPFFQPLKGKFGSVTDVSYAANRFNFNILNGSVLDLDRSSESYGDSFGPYDSILSGRAKTSQFVIKEDFSFGLSDTLAVIGMLQYDKTKNTFDNWGNGEPDDTYSNSGVNIFGIGLQNRFIDNEKWIATISGFYQHQKDTLNTFIGELKIGRKINRTTIYGLGRIGYSNLIKGDIYGAYVDGAGGDWLMLSYKTNVKDFVYAEGGLGAFAVLNKYFTANVEAIYGSYDWHNQLSIKGAIGVQPGDNFALNLYASTALYDSAKGKVNKYMNYDVDPEVSGIGDIDQSTNLVYTTGNYEIKDYIEWKVGVQAILYF